MIWQRVFFLSEACCRYNSRVLVVSRGVSRLVGSRGISAFFLVPGFLSTVLLIGVFSGLKTRKPWAILGDFRVCLAAGEKLNLVAELRNLSPKSGQREEMIVRWRRKIVFCRVHVIVCCEREHRQRLPWCTNSIQSQRGWDIQLILISYSIVPGDWSNDIVFAVDALGISESLFRGTLRSILDFGAAAWKSISSNCPNASPMSLDSYFLTDCIWSPVYCEWPPWESCKMTF